MRRTLITALIALALTAACGGDGGDDDTPPGQAGGDLTPCDQLPGTPTDDVLAAGSCDDNGQTMVYGSMSYSCPDGRTLHWNDEGWGYSGDAWQAHARPDGQLIPPQPDIDACT